MVIMATEINSSLVNTLLYGRVMIDSSRYKITRLVSMIFDGPGNYPRASERQLRRQSVFNTVSSS